MADALVSASHLKADIRLAQAVSEFEASLKGDHKSIFRNWKIDLHTRPPDAWEVKRLTVELDRSVAQRTRRCYGPRFINVLESVQQYASLGDVVLGGSQNLTACGAWAVVRLTLTMLSHGAAHIERLSLLFMRAGQNAPRYQNMALLYSQSYRLRDGLCEYFILVIHLCTYAVRFINKTTISQISTSAFDTKLSKLEKDLNLWASFIMEEVTSLNNQVVVDEARHNSTFRKMVTRFKSSSEHGRRLDAKLRLLDWMSTHDYQMIWKQARKRGLATWFTTSSEYGEWKDTKSSSTLLCSGKLGSGKTTLMASMVDDLTLATPAGQVAYFFCRHDIAETLSAKTVLGCLARQLLLYQSIDFEKLECDYESQISSQSCDGVWKALQTILPADGTYYLLIDGLDECSHHDLERVIDVVRNLQQLFKVHVCISFRTEARSFVGTRAKSLTEPFTLIMPEKNPDIDAFILCELNARLESEELSIGSSSVMTAICDALQNGAQGMFLWVSLLLDWICAEHTDEAILRALHDLPKDLTETFTRILESHQSHSTKYQRAIVQLIMAARRPLTTEELQEALSVTPGKTDWDPMRRINNIHATLACCRSLLIVDEEESTVRFAHHSVKAFFMEYEGETFSPVSPVDADDEMGRVILTYANYGIFDQQVSRMTIPNIPAGSTPSTVISSALKGTSASTKHLVEGLLRSRASTNPDVRKVLAETTLRYQGFRLQNPVHFLDYARSHYQFHVRPSLVETGTMKRLWEQVIDHGRLDMRITSWLKYQLETCQVQGLVGSFLPWDILDRMCTPWVIRAVLRESGNRMDHLLIPFNDNKRCFATLVTQDMTDLVRLFQQIGLSDRMLPITPDLLKATLVTVANQFSSRYFAITIKNFCHSQHSFASAILPRNLPTLSNPVIPLIPMAQSTDSGHAGISTTEMRAVIAVIPRGHHQFSEFDSDFDNNGGIVVVVKWSGENTRHIDFLEAQATTLPHTHLMTILAAFQADGSWFEIWPLVSSNLSGFWVMNSGRSQEQSMVAWSWSQMIQLANALCFLHAGRASTFEFHGCISPQSIMWRSLQSSAEGILKIDMSRAIDPPSYHPSKHMAKYTRANIESNQAFDMQNLLFICVQFLAWNIIGSVGPEQVSAAVGKNNDELYKWPGVSDTLRERVGNWAWRIGNNSATWGMNLYRLDYIGTWLRQEWNPDSQAFAEGLEKMTQREVRMPFL